PSGRVSAPNSPGGAIANARAAAGNTTLTDTAAVRVPDITVIPAVPVARPVTTPTVVIETIAGVVVLHIRGAPAITWFAESRATAVICRDWPTSIDAGEVIASDTTAAGVGLCTTCSAVVELIPPKSAWMFVLPTAMPLTVPF